jgi:predicted nucleic-acid-binding protein
MIAADTNLLIRHLTQDDPKQAERVRDLFDAAELRQEPIFLAHIVLCEVSWVLKAVYGFDKPQISVALRALLDDAAFHVQERTLVEEALTLYKRHAGQFSDHLLGVVATHNGASTTYTFDKAVGKFTNFTLLK